MACTQCCGGLAHGLTAIQTQGKTIMEALIENKSTGNLQITEGIIRICCNGYTFITLNGQLCMIIAENPATNGTAQSTFHTIVLVKPQSTISICTIVG